MRVLAWVPEERDSSPGQRYRIEQWEPYLRAEGIEITLSPFVQGELRGLLQRSGTWGRKFGTVFRSLLRRLVEATRVSGFDLVYIFREGALLGPALAERILVWRGIPTIFDFDDAVWVRYVSPANSYLSYLRFPGKTRTLCRLARHVMAGNPYLRDYASRYNEAVTVVPSTIDTQRYRPGSRRANAVPTIGWTGSYSTVQYLGLVRPVLERLRRRLPFKFVVVGVEGFRAEGVEVEDRPWRSATEPEDLSSLDVGIMPLTNSSWERGKCGMKALQYMALGIPPVVSPVGVNAEIVKHGHNGLLAASEAEWETALEELITKPALRERLGTAARKTVEDSYSAAVHAPRVARIFRSLAP